MKQKILVAVTGMTPQIVTETVYALHQNHQWVPEKIIVLTTLTGKQQIVAQLLGENGYFQRLRQDFRLPQIEFEEHCILVINENGTKLEDIRTAEQNNAAADLIVQTIHDLCQDDNTELHVSIAGGRKSMGFYVGYALSLFGRAQDKMSHVLVDENFEMERAFFYPAPQEQFINTKKGMLDAAKAQVMLAEIPFVRMMENKLQFAFEQKFTFSQAVTHIQQMLNGTSIRFDVATCTVQIGNTVSFKLKTADFCVYAAMAKRKQQGKITKFFSEPELADFIQDYLHFYQYHQTELRGDSCEAKKERKLRANDLAYPAKNKPYSEMQRIFNEASAHIKKDLKIYLDEYGARFAIKSKGNKKSKNRDSSISYDLAIDARWIEIVEA